MTPIADRFLDLPWNRPEQAPRGRNVVRWKQPKDKHSRYRVRCQDQERCPHCGVLCAPFYECENRRRYKRLHYVLKKGVRMGIFFQTTDGKYGVCERSQEKEGRRLPPPEVVGKY